ncbi:M20/M25/M40 family metallo-hydrolase [Mesobacillus subterraneus]|uniref:M20 family metallopeptidase n=1 Tax=Mesobacillus subterraneus TaxID=285983 RepID=UPI00203FE56E|nr:M20/M25/M40 family metallo-hydrolase [Mesobacillus subterraneus]MCM3665263.1 M20/M25/M40 family metallo-hydrolase [Mesobacillus subterraneus]MCM3684276.1 M20/M25/M40 family metallo-hydrolase [Mesobacillus subterraneus]
MKELLKELLLIDSSTKEGANQAVEFCKQWLIEHELQPNLIENNGYKMLVCEIGEGETTFVFNGHVDVVSGKKEQFVPVEKEGRIYARGAADMKAGVAAMMFAMKELSNQRLGVKIQLQIVSDEEIGGYNCSGYLVENGYRGDFVICSEPTQLGIALQAKGVLRLEVEVSGKSAHGSRPWEGDNAIVKAYKVYEKVLELPFTQDSSEFYQSPSINLAIISGGEVFNKVPNQCIMSLDIRYLPGQNPDVIVEQIKNISGGEVRIGLNGIPVATERDNLFITRLKPVLEKHIGGEAVIFGQHGAADTQYFSAHGIPAIEFGPSGGNWHGDDEFVEYESIEKYKDVLVDFIKTY